MNLFLILMSMAFQAIHTAPTTLLTDQEQTQASILSWADSTFTNHSNYKFDGLRVFETDEYEIQSMRLELYQEKINALKDAKEKGTYSGTDESYENDLTKLTAKLTQTNEIISTLQRVDYYETHFWTNIQTTDGITVYYELIIKQNHVFKVIEAIENSSIGKKVDGSKIAYKPSPPLLWLSKNKNNQ